MHPQSHHITIGGTVPKESNYSDVLGQITHLIPSWLLRNTFARFPEQLLKDLVFWGSPDEYLMIVCFLRDTFGVFSCPFWSTVLQCGARLPIHIDCVVGGASFLTMGLEECNIAHRLSIAVLCVVYNIRSNLMHTLYDDMLCASEGYVPERVTRCVLVIYRYIYGPPRCRTSQYRRTFILWSGSLRSDHGDPLFAGVGVAGFKSKANAFWLH